MREDLVLVLPTLGFGKFRENWDSWGDDVVKLNVQGIRPLTAAYQDGYECAKDLYPHNVVIGFAHDDVTCMDAGWAERVIAEFSDPAVGLVGFGGSTGHGVPQIYKVPYEWEQVGRTGVFMSNMVNAELHGMRITTAADASFCDGFALFVRRSILDTAGGWPQGTPVAYWQYDAWISCEVRRQGKRVRVVGVSCEHTCPETHDPTAVRQYVIDEDCQAAHQWLYENYRDTFPAAVPLKIEEAR